MQLSVTGARLELGRVLAQQARGLGGGAIHVNLSGQRANTLLHDGQAWKDFPRTVVAATHRAIRAAQTGRATVFVQASFAFVRAVERGARVDEPLRSCVEAILECEALVMRSGLQACVVRLGYLYGPVSDDLLAYRKAFRLGRPYWSGPAGAGQYHLHQLDAASALLAASRPRNAGSTYYATDGRNVSFERFMDAFAHRVGRRNPLHLPRLSHLLARLIIREEHMQQTALGMPPGTPSPRVPGWVPTFPDYRKGLDQVVEAWRH
jgi:nucleoside-diphosphate-sugar epimerase